MYEPTDVPPVNVVSQTWGASNCLLKLYSTLEMYMAGREVEQSRAEKDKVQPLAAERVGVGGGTDIRERQGQKHNQSQEHSPWTHCTDTVRQSKYSQ